MGRRGDTVRDIDGVRDNYRYFRKLVQDEKLKTRAQELNDIAQAASLGEYDLVGIDGNRFNVSSLSPEAKSEYTALKTRFHRLDTRLKEMYKKLIQDY